MSPMYKFCGSTVFFSLPPLHNRAAGPDSLIYVKEDLIIPQVPTIDASFGCDLHLVLPPPQHHTFYDFIVTKARGKSGECMMVVRGSHVTIGGENVYIFLPTSLSIWVYMYMYEGGHVVVM